MTPFAVFLLWSGFGWLLLAIGLSTGRGWRKKLDREYSRAAGTIAGHAEQRHINRGHTITVYYPIVSFNADGTEVSFRDDYAIETKDYPVGTPVEVCYDPGDPSRFHLVGGPAGAHPGRLAAIIGIVWIAVAAIATLAMYALSSGYGLNVLDALRDTRLFHALFR